MSRRVKSPPFLEAVLDEQLRRCQRLVAIGEQLLQTEAGPELDALLEQRRALLDEIVRLQVLARLGARGAADPSRAATTLAEIRETARRALALDDEYTRRTWGGSPRAVFAGGSAHEPKPGGERYRLSA
ncbi:MAG: hypothetical protein D6776_04410 [Planctomycetota bacterium]|nr:MAG: hypothetical protein D6776_04410 [Planctomycetota bacterium]